MARIGSLRISLDKESKGTWVVFESGIRLLIARIGNPLYRDSLRTLTEQRKATLNQKNLTEEQQLDIQKAVVAETILLGWENVQDDAGNDIPYSSEQALTWFRDPELRPLWNFVLTEAMTESNFRKGQLEEAAKN